MSRAALLLLTLALAIGWLSLWMHNRASHIRTRPMPTSTLTRIDA